MLFQHSMNRLGIEYFLYLKRRRLKKNEYFAEENKTARQIAFLKSGVVRAFFINQVGKDYNKQFFVGQLL